MGAMTFTDDQIDELVAEARRWANGHPNRRSGELMAALVDALAQVKAERDDYRMTAASRVDAWRLTEANKEIAALRDDIGNLEVERDTLRRDLFLMGQEETKALYERDALRAVIEEALRVPDAVSIDSRTWRNVAEEQRRILSAALDTEKGEAS